MHIPDGFLDPKTIITTAVISAGALGYGIKKVNQKLGERQVPLLGLTAAFIFAAQMLNFPVVGGTSGHFLGGVLAAVLLGPWAACLIMAVVLIVQSIGFADGGLTALGANIFNMGVVGGHTILLRLCSRKEMRAPYPPRLSFICCHSFLAFHSSGFCIRCLSTCCIGYLPSTCSSSSHGWRAYAHWHWGGDYSHCCGEHRPGNQTGSSQHLLCSSKCH
ncbi:cobalt/nickel transport system permease protein [Candidatus Hakubella thermalkaliphila]|uniref:Cobalt/nickel transport system permease protein n=1 Tax=Candidatus Hakubella thermalkaliphila TaxID=2754717 RepID=A0A6V8PF36_9ACTN|nr:cobalt/nickel transport system permease protein [Candidatus Hakubella thermalkaliphila]